MRACSRYVFAKVMGHSFVEKVMRVESIAYHAGMARQFQEAA